ncbi:hypothetical protein PN437_09965 [Microcystis aeruginosa CS-564/01]|uniref:hypothetical protein n=1 Tax=Microcystis aeruginosa TaxID=1126 RepID=UPI00232FDF2E|nr:hypothetical protein [Microcystis aeruginosa]MDB9425217.1 hypothetical protein [Microcystis aeruginosa CS-564/01]
MIIGCLIAGFYGVLHNQISFTVSEEYFTKFKFIQFNIPPAIPERFGASIVGFLASWWMGILIGIIIIPFGLIIPRWKDYFISVIRAFGLVAITTFVIGLSALICSLLIYDDDYTKELKVYGNSIININAFMMAGTMHNYSYLGGIVGIVVGGFWLILERKWAKSKINNTAQQGDAPEPES